MLALLFEAPRLELTLPFMLAFAYQIFVPGLAATLLWFALVKRIGAVRAATFHFLNPFFGVVIAALLLGLWSLLTWGVLTVLGLDPGWVQNAKPLIEQIPYAALIDQWIPGWQPLLLALLERAAIVPYFQPKLRLDSREEIGRASCRERVSSPV